MTHTLLDIFLFVLFAGAIGFLVGQVWPSRLPFLAPRPIVQREPEPMEDFPPLGVWLDATGPIASVRRNVDSHDRDRHESDRASLATTASDANEEAEKWRRRAARLVAALRERDSTIGARDRALAQMQDQIAMLQKRGSVAVDSTPDTERAMRDLEAQLQVQRMRVRDAERQRNAVVTDLHHVREELDLWKQRWQDVRDELSRRDDALAALEQALSTQPATASEALVADEAVSHEIAQLQAAAAAQQHLNTELMQSLQDRRRRILVLETELNLLKQSNAAREPSADADRDVAPATGDPAPDAVPDEADASFVDPVRPVRLTPIRPLEVDDLTRIQGIGRRLAERLNRLGIWRFEQLATLTDGEVAWVEAQDAALRARIRRDNWVEQAADLALLPPPHTLAPQLQPGPRVIM